MLKLDSLLTHLALTHKTVTCRTLREGLTDMLAPSPRWNLHDPTPTVHGSLLDLSLQEMGNTIPCSSRCALTCVRCSCKNSRTKLDTC